MANSLDIEEMTFSEALIRYRLTGQPLPAHLKHMMNGPIKGHIKKPGFDRLPDHLQWSKPWYRNGGNGHDGNGSSMHGRSPGMINHRALGELTKADLKRTEPV